ncbi:hypothetical protein P0L94_10080 [Microbacter sp. GSS18]|nr:hypothetical protein P0L94_10080 [Microbacter sp. GSS18]
MNGCLIRTAQLQNPASGRCVAVAFDHGGGGMPPGGADVPAILDVVCASGAADAVLLGPGLSRAAGSRLAAPSAPALITALDAPIFGARPGEHGDLITQRRLLDAGTALRNGATSAKVAMPLGLDDADRWADSVSLIAGAIEDAHAAGLPVMVEPALWGPVAAHDDELIAHSARVSWELGADSVKIHATEDAAVLARIVDHSPGPVYVLGGAPASAEAFLADVDRWIDAGVAGVVVGRNVWARPEPGRMIRALAAVVHDRDLDAARAVLREEAVLA